MLNERWLVEVDGEVSASVTSSSKFNSKQLGDGNMEFDVYFSLNSRSNSVTTAGLA